MTLWHCCQDGGSTPPISTTDLRVGEMVTRLVHTQKIGGSIPPPATKKSVFFVIFIIFIYEIGYNKLLYAIHKSTYQKRHPVSVS